IALFDEEEDTVDFVYYADVVDDSYRRRPATKRKAARGLTEYAIRSQQPQILGEQDIRNLYDRGEIEVNIDLLPQVWLGIPMMLENTAIGLIAIQDYHQPEAYNEDDVALLLFIAGQVAQFVDKLRTDEIMRQSEARFRAIYNQAAVGIARIDPDGTFLQVNQRMADIFGYSVEEMFGIKPKDIVHPGDAEVGNEELRAIRAGTISSYTKEKRYVHKSGQTIIALLNVSAQWEAGELRFIIAVYEDITEKKRAQQETRLLLNLSDALDGARSTKDAFRIAMDQVSTHGEWDYGQIWLANGHGKLEMQEYCFLSRSDLGDLHRSMLASSKLNGQAEAVANHALEPMWEVYESEVEVPAHFKHPYSLGYETAVHLPATHHDGMLGVIVLMSRRKIPKPTNAFRLFNAVRTQIQTVVLRKKAEIARKESEKRYRAITEAAFDGILIHHEARILDVNEGLARMFGYTEAELFDLSVTDLTYEENPEEWLAKISRDEGTSMEFTGRKKNGDAIFLEAVGQWDAWKGKAARLLAIRDITDQKLIEEAREAARIDARFRAYIRNSSEIIKILDLSGKLSYCSPTYLRVTGHEPEKLVGQTLHAAFLPEEKVNVDRVLAECMAAPGNSVTVQLRMPAANPSGACIVQSVFTNLSSDPLVNGILISSRDVTEIVKAQASMRESEERFRSLFERSPDAIFLQSEEGYILDVNEEGAKLHGIPREEIVGKHLTDLVPGGEHEAVMESFNKLLSGEVTNTEGRSVSQQGKVTPVEIRANVIQFQNQKAVILQVRDITERQAAEQRMRKSQAQLRVQNETLVELASGAAVNSGNLRRAFQEITKVIADVLDIDRSSIWLFSEDDKRLQCHTMYDRESGLWGSGWDLDTDEFPEYLKAIRTQRVIVAVDALDDPRIEEFAEVYLEPEGILSAMDAPFRHKARIAGVIWSETRNHVRKWSPEAQSFVASMADMVTLALESWERKNAEEELANTYGKMRSTFESTQDGILIVDKAGKVLEYNQAFVRISKIPEAVLNSGDFNPGFTILVEQLVDPDHFTKVVRSLEKNPIDGRRNVFRLKDGRVIEMYARPMLVDSEIRGRLWFLHDITDLKRIENALLENERKNKAILDAIPDLMMRIRSNGVVLDYKLTDQQALFQEDRDIIGSPIGDLLPEAITRAVMNQMAEALSTGEPQQKEEEVESGGELRDYETRLVRSGPDEGLVMIRDVTERKRTEKELIKRNFELDSFVYRASHDLKAPLNSLMGLIGLAEDESQEVMVLQYLKMMNKSVTKLDTFIRDLADFSRNARLELDVSRMDWEQAVQESLENLRFMENSDRVAKNVNIQAKRELFTDPVRVGIVLNNLISNSIKYQNLKREDAYVNIDITDHARGAKIQISDNGI
ncbi:MAG: PAS domain S-box protein, partial [Bacteroidota bacterium]